LTSDGTPHGAIAESGLTYGNEFLTLYGAQRTRTTKTLGVSSTTVVESFAVASGQSCQFEYYVVNGSNATRTGVVMATWDSSTTTWTEYSTPDLNGTTEGIDFRVGINSPNVELTATVTSGTWTVIVNTRIIF